MLPNVSSENLLRAYRKRLREAKGDKVKQQLIEDAHSRIMMSNLSARMKVLASARAGACQRTVDQ